MYRKPHTRTLKNGSEKVAVLIAENIDGTCWWAIKGSHFVHLCPGPVPRSGAQCNNIPDLDVFTYYGNGSNERPDNVANMETLLWLLRDKQRVIKNIG